VTKQWRRRRPLSLVLLTLTACVAQVPNGSLMALTVCSLYGGDWLQTLQISLRRCQFVCPIHRYSVRLTDLRVSCHKGARTLAEQEHFYDFSS
jgi:hypothetical protein